MKAEPIVPVANPESFCIIECGMAFDTSVRDRAILATLLYHGIRREELCGLRVKDLHSRQGVMHFRVKGKRSKIRFVPVNAAAQRMIEDYLALTGHRSDVEGALFRPVKNNQIGRAHV